MQRAAEATTYHLFSCAELVVEIVVVKHRNALAELAHWCILGCSDSPGLALEDCATIHRMD